MIREIVLYGDPVLRLKCPPLTTITPEILALAEDMVETMEAAEGVGLAAPQIGETLRLAVIDVTGAENPCTFLKVDGEDANLADYMPLKFTNPELNIGKAKAVMNEGCLSFPDVRTEIRRGDAVKATLTLLDGRTILLETDGLLSRAIQHETDHLNGILFIDRATPAAKLSLKKKIRKMWEEYGSEEPPSGR
jgi:peptide deformylase